jgi:TPR repeat protein
MRQAIMYTHGQGVNKDFAAAKRHLERAATLPSTDVDANGGTTSLFLC